MVSVRSNGGPGFRAERGESGVRRGQTGDRTGLCYRTGPSDTTRAQTGGSHLKTSSNVNMMELDNIFNKVK